jgi:UDP-glucose 4-epimerase
MTVVVIGAGGYVGRNLLARFSAIDQDVFAVSSGTPGGINKQTGLFPSGLEFPRNAKAVYFLAQSPHYRLVPDMSAHLLAVNCVLAVRAAEMARRAGIRRFIYASTGNVYAPSLAPLPESAPVRRDNWYALSKVMGEEALAMYSQILDVTAARIFGVYGPGQVDRMVPNIIDSVLHEREVFVERNPDDATDLGGLKVSLIYIDDLVDALIALADKAGCPTINLAGTQPVSISQIANSVSALSGHTARITVRETARAFDLIADTRLQQRLLGPCRYDLTSGLRSTLARPA